MSGTDDRSDADVNAAVASVLADFRARRISADTAAELQTAAAEAEAEDSDTLSWAGVTLMGLTIFGLLALRLLDVF